MMKSSSRLAPRASTLASAAKSSNDDGTTPHPLLVHDKKTSDDVDLRLNSKFFEHLRPDDLIDIAVRDSIALAR